MPVLLLKNAHCSSGGIEGDIFRKFLLSCLSFSTSFSLSKYIPQNSDMILSTVEKELAQYSIKTFEPRNWFGYPEIPIPKIQQTVYNATESSIDIISLYYQDVFLRNIKKVPKTRIDTFGYKSKQACRLNDLCFWNRKTMIVGTLSHEFICATNNISVDFAQQLHKIADWEVLDSAQFGIADVSI